MNNNNNGNIQENLSEEILRIPEKIRLQWTSADHIFQFKDGLEQTFGCSLPVTASVMQPGLQLGSIAIAALCWLSFIPYIFQEPLPFYSAFSSPESPEHGFYLLITAPHVNLLFLKTEEMVQWNFADMSPSISSHHWQRLHASHSQI